MVRPNPAFFQNMKSITIKWSIYLITLCSFPRCSNVTKLFSNVIEDNMKTMDEIISKSKSYNKLVETFRQNWESPVNYLVERGYIPIEEAKPDKSSRETIEKMQKQYEENDNDLTNEEGGNAVNKNFGETDIEFRNMKGFRQKKACITTTEEPPIVHTETTTCKTGNSETMTTTEQIESTTAEKPTCEPPTINPLSDVEETTTFTPVETTTAPTDNGESSSTTKNCTPSSNTDECEYEDTATDCEDDGHANGKTHITTTPQLPAKTLDENTTPCENGEETTTTPKPIDDKPDSATECFFGNNYDVKTAFPFRFQFDYPPMDYPVNDQRKVESAITALRGRPGAFELAKEIAESTVAEYTHNLSQLANRNKSVRGENNKRKRSENLKLKKTQDRSTKTKFQNPTWYSHPKQWNPQERPWQSKQSFFHYSPPTLQSWHSEHPYPKQTSRQKMTGKIVQRPFSSSFRKDHQRVQSHGLKNFKSRLKADPIVTKKILNLSKPMSKTAVKGYVPKKQFSNFHKKEKSFAGKGSSLFTSKSQSARNDLDYFDANNEDYIYDDSDAYIALNSVYLGNKMDIGKDQKFSHGNSVKSDEIANATQMNQNFDSLPLTTSSDSKVWSVMKGSDKSKDSKMVFDGDSLSFFQYSSPQRLTPKEGYENVNSENPKSTSLSDNLNLEKGYTNPNNLGSQKLHINDEKLTDIQQPMNSQSSYSKTDNFYKNDVDKTPNSYVNQLNHDEWKHFKPGETETEFFKSLEAKYLNEYQKPDNVSNPNLYNTQHHLDWEQPDTNERTNNEDNSSTGTSNKETQNNWKSGIDFSKSLDYGGQNSGSASSKSMDSNGFSNLSTNAGSAKSAVFNVPNSASDISKPAKVQIYMDYQNSKNHNQQKTSSDSNNQKETKYYSQEGKSTDNLDDGFSMSVEDIPSNYWKNQKGNKPESSENSDSADKSKASHMKTDGSPDIFLENGSNWKYSKPNTEGAIGFVKPEAVAIKKYGGGVGNIYLKLATAADSKGSDLKPTGSHTKNRKNNAYSNNYLVPTFDSNLKPKNKFLKNANLVAKKEKGTSQSYNYKSYSDPSSWKEPNTMKNENENSISKQNYHPLGELSFLDFGKKQNTNLVKNSETYNENSMHADQIKYPSESILNLYRYKNMNKNLEDVFKQGLDQKPIPMKPYSYNDDKTTFTRSLRYNEPRVDLTEECKDIVKQAVHNITTSKFPEMAYMNLRKRATPELKNTSE